MRTMFCLVNVTVPKELAENHRIIRYYTNFPYFTKSPVLRMRYALLRVLRISFREWVTLGECQGFPGVFNSSDEKRMTISPAPSG